MKPLIRREQITGWVATAALVLASPGVSAASYFCQGVPVGVSVDPAGSVSVESLGGLPWVYLCSLSAPSNGATVEGCKAAYSVLMTAQTTGRSARIWVDNSLTCSTHPSWTWLQGWYFGPQLL